MTNERRRQTNFGSSSDETNFGGTGGAGKPGAGVALKWEQMDSGGGGSARLESELALEEEEEADVRGVKMSPEAPTVLFIDGVETLSITLISRDSPWDSTVKIY